MLALIGGGYWGKNLVRNFHSLGVLSAVCDRDEDAIQRTRKQYPDLLVTPSFSDILNNPAIKAVAIATPAELHYLHAHEALLAGKDVYVEKPLALDQKHASELVALAREQKSILMVGHLLQYHNAFLKLKEMVKSGELGRVNYIYSNRLNLGKIRREENALWSFAPHDISMILALAGEMPESLFAAGGNYLHQKISDVTTTHLNFPSGLKAHIFVSWLHPFKEQKLVVVGDKKMVVFNDLLPWDQKLEVYPHHIEWSDGVPVPVKAEGEPVILEEGEPLKAECAHFIECIKQRKTPRTDGMEGTRVLQILNAAQESLEAGTVIKITEKDPGKDSTFFKHQSAIIDAGVTVGEGTKIWHFSHIMGGSKIGKECNIGQNVVVGPDVAIGNYCKVQNNISIFKGVTLEDYVFCGPSVVFTNVFNPRAEIKRMDQIRPTLVRKGATLGANSTIVCGTTIGRYAFVAAGSVVTRNVPDYALVMGNPARRMGWMCRCGERLGDDFICPVCDTHYNKNEQGLLEKI
ncbi:MAG: Gfo/Idh/MocA family oxidoreductase [Deltaproteobacteria bacterium]|nr:Gfo/Idh/MocA family oxidoreductase [Candidatus Tharpella aukensis]